MGLIGAALVPVSFDWKPVVPVFFRLHGRYSLILLRVCQKEVDDEMIRGEEKLICQHQPSPSIHCNACIVMERILGKGR